MRRSSRGRAPRRRRRGRPGHFPTPPPPNFPQNPNDYEDQIARQMILNQIIALDHQYSLNPIAHSSSMPDVVGFDQAIGFAPNYQVGVEQNMDLSSDPMPNLEFVHEVLEPIPNVVMEYVRPSVDFQFLNELLSDLRVASNRIGDEVVAPSVASSGSGPAGAASAECSALSLCNLGCETVQDIYRYAQSIFRMIKNSSPDGGNTEALQEKFKLIRMMFQQLRVIYAACNENREGTEYADTESLIPYADTPDTKREDRTSSEAYRTSCEERDEIRRQLERRSKEIKKVIYDVRLLIFKFNSLFAAPNC